MQFDLETNLVCIGIIVILRVVNLEPKTFSHEPKTSFLYI
jgi:hypothetical protein